MSEQFAVATHGEAADLVNYFSRARRVNDASARLVAAGGILMAYVGVLFPRGLLDRTPTVLGLRVIRLVKPVEFDEIVPLESLVARIESAIDASDAAEGEISVSLPASSPTLPLAATRRSLASAAGETTSNSSSSEVMAVAGSIAIHREGRRGGLCGAGSFSSWLLN